MTYPVPAGSRVVFIGEDCDDLTRGRAYRVASCYEGASGCGPQDWVRVQVNTGRVYGRTPESFIRARQNVDVAFSVLRAIDCVRPVIEAFSGPLLAAAKGPLADAVEDLEGVLRDPYTEAGNSILLRAHDRISRVMKDLGADSFLSLRQSLVDARQHVMLAVSANAHDADVAPDPETPTLKSRDELVASGEVFYLGLNSNWATEFVDAASLNNGPNPGFYCYRAEGGRFFPRAQVRLRDGYEPVFLGDTREAAETWAAERAA